MRRPDGSTAPLRVCKEHVFGVDRRVPTLDLRVEVTNTGEVELTVVTMRFDAADEAALLAAGLSLGWWLLRRRRRPSTATQPGSER